MDFEQRYKKLNKEQKEAVDTIDGPIMVVAGPGTGKTEILTMRIANILAKTDTAPENILALTFTEAAAVNMRKRLSFLVGPLSYRVVIKTFHSFCNDIITSYPEHFPKIIGSAPISEVEAISIIEKKVLEEDLSLLRPWGDQSYYIRDIQSKIEELKREGLSPEEFEKNIEETLKKFLSRNDLYHEKGPHSGKMKGDNLKYQKKIIKNKELAIIYRAYQAELFSKRFYDWSDMIMEVLRAVREDLELKLILQENHQYILVDEHQDTNNAQNKIIEILCDFHKSPNIFVVGDEKQAIFRFQGASVENFLYFKKLYPEAKIIELSKNYRSGQLILDAAHAVISSKKNLEAGTEKISEIKIANFQKLEYEDRFVAEKIVEKIKEGHLPEEIAVIYRTNSEAFTIAAELERLNVKFVIESDEDLLSEKFVRRFLTILDAINNVGNDEFLVGALHLPEFSLEPLQVFSFLKEASLSHESLYNTALKSENVKIQEIIKKISNWASVSYEEEVTQFLERVLRESGILQNILNERSAESFLSIERLFSEAKRISSARPASRLVDFMEFINLVREHKIFLRRPKHHLQKGFVRLMTAHRAKGLEFDSVFIIHATEKSFGPKSDREKLPLLLENYQIKEINSKEDLSVDSAEDDERRLFYVALTRAKNEVFISYSDEDKNGQVVLPSPFILEIRPEYKTSVDVSVWQEALVKNPTELYSERKKNSATSLDSHFVAELFASRPLSVSALNNYLACPWKYFYRNLLRLPEAPLRHQIYGTAMHTAVEEMWRKALERGVDKKFLLDSYERNLSKLGLLSTKEYAEALERGKNALSGWFDYNKPELKWPVMAEFVIPAVELKEGILLYGKLDKVEVLDRKKYIVTDYKTGKHKSRNEIEGKTKNSNGDIYRQLVFYKLLLDLHDNIEMTLAIVDFLEPDEDSGKYRKEEFVISSEDTDELKKTIIKMAEEVTSLAFWNKKCDDKECQYCRYGEMMM